MAVFSAGALFIFLFSSCGEMDSLFPISQTYQVSAIAGERSLEEYALLAQDDKITPFFVHSVKGDPDIAGLKVLLQTAEGIQAGKAVLYTAGFEGDEEPENLEAEKEEEYLLARMDGDLPSFSIPSDQLKPGAYVAVFQVLGKDRKPLARTERAVYYLADKDYHITGIGAYLPEDFSGSYLIPPGTPVLLEARIAADEGLDPWVAWYNGRTRIGGGRLSDGANRIIWKVPARTGFRYIRVETVPFPPIQRGNTPAAARADNLLRGKTRELSLPVSAKETFPKSQDEKTEEGLLALYRFSGDIQDARIPEKKLIPRDSEKGVPCWLPGDDHIYGLAIGPLDAYLVPLDIPEQEPGEQGRGAFIFRFKPLNDGLIFSASFREEGNGPELALSVNREAFVLTMKAGDWEENIAVEIPGREEFVTLSPGFIIREDQFTVFLGEEAKTLALAVPLSGEVIFQIGGKEAGKNGEGEEGEDDGENTEAEEILLPAAILDELAVTYVLESFTAGDNGTVPAEVEESPSGTGAVAGDSETP
jgi:hypothetical protein